MDRSLGRCHHELRCLLSVLQPVQRRRRRRRRRRGAVLARACCCSRSSRRIGRRGAALPRRAVARARRAPSGAGRPRRARARPRGRIAPRRVPSCRSRSCRASRPLEQPPLPAGLSASAAILVDADSGTVIWAQNAHPRHLIASTTKIMTATIALERLRAAEIVRVAEAATRAAPFREGLRKGERVRAWKLLYGLLLYSGNDDAVALAIASAGSRGALHRRDEREGTRARHARHALLDAERRGRPRQLLDRLGHGRAGPVRAAEPALREVVATRRIGVNWSAPTFAKVYVNKNQLLGTYRGADGVKTGWTTLARHCLVASAHRGKVRLIAVVLHSENPSGDARRLLNLGFRVRG